jgi:methyl-accepting chemotaxis protein
MQWFYDMKIGTKLISGFILIALIAGLIGFVGIRGVNSVTRESTQLYEKQLIPITELNDISIAFQRVRVNIRDLMNVAKTTEEIAKYQQTIKEMSEIISKSSDAFEKTMVDPEEKKLFATFMDTRKVYRPQLEKIAQLALAGKKDEANVVMLGDARTAAMAEQSAIDKLVDYKVEMAKKANIRALAVSRSSIVLASLFMAVGIILAIGLGLFITGTIRRPLQEAVEIAQQVAAGDLTNRIVVTSKDETGQLLQALKDMGGSLVKIVSEVRGGSDSIASATKQIAAGNTDLSQRTDEQAAALEETAASMEELTSTVRQNADNSQQANQLAVTASSVATKGGDVIGRVVNTMSSISESSRKISDIIGVIDGIAFQTNILALNAAVEAARAGEQGRGFAVVAAEVRSLAQRSAAAAKEIKTLINDSVDKVEGGNRLVEEAGQTMQEIVTSIKRVTDIMAEISAASQEQSTGIEQVNTAITQMDDVTQQNAALVEEAAAAAESLEEQARNLVDAISRFKLDESHVALPAKIAQSDKKAVAAPQPSARAAKPARRYDKPLTANGYHKAANGYHKPANGYHKESEQELLPEAMMAKAVGHEDEWKEF